MIPTSKRRRSVIISARMFGTLKVSVCRSLTSLAPVPLLGFL
ncbi:rCG49082 [Rattus norvegicus]|uniref:RCG49082 n=1 Tax=Rattus norvegicus TaxID=10116 RepID=A6IFZ3_RAT|nr:rCG49082 [Rattus norvegicus]